MRRREFARNVGLAALFSPFLSLLGDGRARAAEGPAKYVLFFVTNGTDSPAWTPVGSTESSIAFSPLNEPLAALRQDLVIVENLDSRGAAQEHGSPAGLTGVGREATAPFDSIDQLIADRLAALGVTTEFPVLRLGGVTHEVPSTFFRDGRAIQPLTSPIDAFNVIFAGATPPSEDAVAQLRRRRSTLDFVRGELGVLSARLGYEERQKLELHAESIRQLEERLRRRSDEIRPGGACAAPVPIDGAQPLLDAEIDLDLAIHAMRCDLTRVAAVRFGHHQSSTIDLPELGAPGDWHDDFLHGDGAPHARLHALERWLAERFVRAAEALKATPAPDGSGTLFDQTLMVWARDMGDAVVHRGDDMRFVFSGGANGTLRRSPNGRYLDGRGQHHQRALLSCAHAMGIGDFASFGDPDVEAEARTPLPGVTA